MRLTYKSGPGPVVQNYSGFQARSRGERWSWTLKLAQKRSWAGRWNWAAKVGLLSLRVVPQQQGNGHCPCDSAQARELKQQLHGSAQVAAHWRGDTALKHFHCSGGGPRSLRSFSRGHIHGRAFVRVYVRAWALGCFYSHISTQTFRRALTTSVDSCAEIKSAPLVA